MLDYATSVGGIARALQRHIVQIPRRARQDLIVAKAAKVVRPQDLGDQFVQLENSELYRDIAGLDWSDPTYRSIEGLITG